MSWSACFKEVCVNQTKPMHQITHWTIFLSVALTFVFKTIESTSAASYDLIVQYPEIASGSWLVNGIF